VNEVQAEVVVPVPPARAFAYFTADVDRWWRRGERYGGPDVVGHRFEPWVGGRFLQLFADGESALGQIVAWEPPRLLAFSWRQRNWEPGEATEVEVTFEQEGAGTRVLLRHHGFDGITSDVGCDVGYRAGWAELLGWLGEAISEEEATCT
jgi:uncharacterized protein YndB with AHSA1/START domain